MACVASGRSCLMARGLSGPGPRPFAARLAGGKWGAVQGQPNHPMLVRGGSDRRHERFEECRGVPVREPSDVGRRAGRLGRSCRWLGVSQVPGLGRSLHALRAENGSWFRVSRTIPCSFAAGQTVDTSVSRTMGRGSGSAEPSHARSPWVRRVTRAFRGKPRRADQGDVRRGVGGSQWARWVSTVIRPCGGFRNW